MRTNGTINCGQVEEKYKHGCLSELSNQYSVFDIAVAPMNLECFSYNHIENSFKISKLEHLNVLLLVTYYRYKKIRKMLMAFEYKII